jgi:hypothetical protein
MLTAKSILISIVIAALASPNLSLAQKMQKPRPDFLSRTELKACMLKNEELDARSKAMEAARLDNDKQFQIVSDEAKALSELLRTLDNKDEKAVDAFNARNDARNVLVVKLNKEAETLNAVVAEHQADSSEYLAKCATRPYLLDDKNAILKELGRKLDGKQPGSKEKPSRVGSQGSDA